MSRESEEVGSAGVVVIVLAGVLLTFALAGSVLGGLVVGQRRAAAAADLAALAAAESLAPSLGTSAPGEPCEAAQRVGSANGARLRACTVDGLEVLVEVDVEVRAPFGGTWSVPGRARAGPTRSGGR